MRNIDIEDGLRISMVPVIVIDKKQQSTKRLRHTKNGIVDCCWLNLMC